MPTIDDHPDHRHPTRRGFLRATGALAAAAAIPALGASGRRQATEARPAARAGGKARNVIFMVADGMSFGTLALGDMFIRRTAQTGGVGANGGHWVNLWNRAGVRRAVARTHALDSLVTDSAAGGSAWGCGERVNNGVINARPDGTQLLPIQVHAKQRGKAIGVVTTARVTHATPASFYANAARRDYEQVIAEQLLVRGVDVALGGGARSFTKELLAAHAAVRVMRTGAELDNAPVSGRLLGLFDRSHVPYVCDRAATVPSLERMTRAALARLEKSGQGFLLQIEAGRVDHAAHNNDAATLVREQAEFDRTIGTVLEWMEAGGRDDTLLIITTDHANANPGLTLYGSQGDSAFARLDAPCRSFDWIDEQIKPCKTPQALGEKIGAVVKEATGYEMSPSDVQLFVGAASGSRVMPFIEANKWWSVLGAMLADHFGIAFVSPNHTADYVEVTALGPGSEKIGGLINNFDLHGVMVEAMGLGAGELPPDMREKLKMVTPPKAD